ncbi:diguanylate cyclase domain-containing protein [Stenotrophomonas maltophilia]|jgi:diguanylate cyclase (GGDEF)-like protein/PAS domain S-box-containing protein|uniref:sensor domain-containing diguanylate cyclase n=1 Tax=Stenotrophomonas TaxID=40323 RepID=UPI00201CF12D|nr:MULTISPECIES: diguanylate cyclase [Stenotrophomonas]MBN5023619.1 diguanylate cyclase [Stenotrophomonas maltophilia]MDH1272267.1 diguanylate cyclase [Stenotrophomonas sp. GD03937]MDH1483423.1 diguanylate cyclase [Stenotrophomonas sp. GD03712]UQY96559.1 diguanylate cyclase [Stenotrophomonas maltophilia]WON66803.1 diguanylate cyclase [Stenotrophomonas maltophilia]
MDEADRLLEIDRLSLLDTPPEPVFDAIVAAARSATGMTMGLISVVAEQRQWFKANIGLEGVSETSRDISFCTHAIEQDTLFEVADTRQDPRFSSNPLVTGGPRIRHYVGIALGSAYGARIGTLCLLDPMPGVLSPSQRELMVHLARVTTQVLEQRSALLAQVGQAKALHRELKRSEDFLERTNRAARVGGWELDLHSNEVRWTRETKHIHGVRGNYQPTLESALSFYRADSRSIMQSAVQRCIDEGTPWEIQVPMTTADHRDIWVRVVGGRQQVDGHTRLVGAIQDITDERAVLDALEASETRYRRLFHYSLGLICTHTLDGTLTSVNPAAVQSLGFEESQMVGRSLGALMPADRRDAFDAYLARIAAAHTDSGVIELIGADGHRRYWAYHNVLDEEADPPYVLGHAQDVTALRQQERILRELSQRDPLTHCHNRRYLHRLDALVDANWACLLFDLDHFKQINDLQGHRRGDAVLVEFATFLRRPLAEREVVVRLGGDEFLVVLDAPPARLAALEGWYRQHAAAAPTPFSMGSAEHRPGEALAETIHRADTQLYRTRARIRQQMRPAQAPDSGH